MNEAHCVCGIIVTLKHRCAERFNALNALARIAYANSDTTKAAIVKENKTDPPRLQQFLVIFLFLGLEQDPVWSSSCVSYLVV